MLFKLGDGCIASGRVSKDAECKLVGDKNTPVCSFSIIAGKRQDTTTIFVNCKAWRELAEHAACLKKGDSVCVTGSIEEREYNGKTYKTLVADWLSVAKAGASSLPENSPQPDFSPLTNTDDDLPF